MPEYTQNNGGGLFLPDGVKPSKNGSSAPRNRMEDLRRFPETPGGGLVIQPFEMYVAQYQSISNAYRNPDVAYQEDPVTQRAMVQDAVVMEPLFGRMMTVALLGGAVKAENEDDPEEKAAAELATKVVHGAPDFVKYKFALLWAIWYGRAACEHTWAWDRDYERTYADALTNIKEHKPRRLLKMQTWTPVHGDKLTIHQRNGHLGVRVRANSDAARFANSSIGPEGRIRWIKGKERENWSFHRHDIVDSDFFEPQKAGSIAGLGLRERVWWTWFFKQLVVQWTLEWVQRLGTGFTIWFFEADNPASEQKVRAAAENQKQGTQILFPRIGDGTRGPGIERIEASTAGAQFLYQLIEMYCNDIKMMIAGQTLTTQTGATGMGSNVAEQHATTRDLIRRYDALNLDSTLTNDLVGVIQRWCFPRLKGKLRYESVIEKPDPEQMMGAADKLFQWGAPIPQDWAMETVGIPKPKKGEKVLSKAAQQPPGGMPGPGMEGPPGAAGGGQDAESWLMGVLGPDAGPEGGSGAADVPAEEGAAA